MRLSKKIASFFYATLYIGLIAFMMVKDKKWMIFKDYPRWIIENDFG
ncbi:MAG: hypothetical protein RLZZ417_139 [Bacteroidota bacterium]|jgi:hypothetical protein